MTDNDRVLRQRIREESDELLFSRMELSDNVKESIRRQAAAGKAKRKFAFPRAWIVGTAALAAAIILFVGFPMLQNPAAPAPTDQIAEPSPTGNEGASGSELSPLVTTTLDTIEEARTAFGPGVLVPAAAPEGYTLSNIVAVGMKGEPTRDIVFTYTAGEKTITFSASRLAGAFPMELFTKAQVGDAEGYVFEQPELVELYWTVNGINYGIIGPLTSAEAMKFAESAQ
ncbi:hypothetical protein [Cohnella sp. GCM10027633]|uniref:hypothetical protein n=1 Tax=unclassified Cohnella TaxID=2636738 RepID=UPI0036429E0B